MAVTFVALSGTSAQADCTPVAVDATTPAPGSTVTCSGTTLNQNSIMGYGTGNQTGITINVIDGASVTGSQRGLSVGDAVINNGIGATISGNSFGITALGGVSRVTNSGSIVGTFSAGIATVNDISVTNYASGVISSTNNGINAGNGAATLDNAGTVTGSNGAGVLATTGVTAINRAGGVINGDDGIRTAGNAIVTNSGRIDGQQTAIYATGSATVTNNAGGSISGSWLGVYAAGASSVFNAGSISGGNAAINFSGGGSTLTLAPGSDITGYVIGSGSNTLQLGGTGAASFDISRLGAGLQYQAFDTFNKIDSSTWTLTGTSTFAGPVSVNGGTLAVNGNLASASLLMVNPDGTIGGSGTLGAVTILGGTLAPGNSIGTLTIGSLTMTAASTYLVEVSGASSDKTVVTGAAAIAGKVTINPLTRLGSTTTYTILNAGMLTGTFDSVSLTGNFARNARLGYAGNSVLLTLDPGLLSPILPGGASVNQRNVAAGIDNALLGGATLPGSFNALFALSGNDLINALTQVSGETATGAQQASFDAMTQFMGVISDPFSANRSSAPGASSFAAERDALAYAADGRKRTRSERDAYALLTKAPPQIYEPRLNVWAAGFGGSRTTDGDAALGSGRTTSSIGGGAVGADYWFSPETVAGFALAGGGTSFSVAGGGSGRSDLFQAGAFVRHSIAASYITATAAYGWQDISTDRLVTTAGTDRLRANFNANAWSGRIEGGHRWRVPELGGIGLTPYAALQATAFDLPSYAETSINGAGGFALTYAAKTATAARTELGLRSDKSWAMAEGLLTLRGRTAWAHDYNADRSVTATFQSLPGASFVVNGAAAARNAALTSASAEMSFKGGWSIATTFEGEFSDVTRSYAGKGVVRYAW
ncbi:autotransporter domain-containing protein [Tardiphaga sp.]|jgi:autotransporter-associated beta strand protein|uniref:autotransporter outer membrane beta-barrel domain-containing protein n=1 Tax=Tardiphaga sp. TaxID=1926292 RepID=UPI0037D9C5A1